MIERISTRDREKVRKFYDNKYKAGGYLSEENFNRRALSLLGIRQKEGARLLDIACGQGTLQQLAEPYAETYGIDISREAIRKAKNRARKTIFKISSAEKLPFRDDFFNYVTCMGSLEHFYDIDKALSEMRRVAKKGARILIHVPNSMYLVHKMLRIDTQGQINERLATEAEWREILERFFAVEKVHRYNTRWFLQWIPKKYCCHFTFLCRNRK